MNNKDFNLHMDNPDYETIWNRGFDAGLKFKEKLVKKMIRKELKKDKDGKIHGPTTREGIFKMLLKKIT
jgi:hypothetical protein